MNVNELVIRDKIISQDIENQLRTKIKFKVNCEHKPLKKIMIDFGPYPLHKDWLSKNDSKSKTPLNIKES